MSTRARYWMLQAIGWGGYSLAGAGIGAYYGGWNAALVLGYVLYFLYSIGLTETFRQIMRRRRWLNPPVRGLWLRLAGGVLIIAAIQFVLVISINEGLDPAGGGWPLDAKLGLAWGTTLATGSWTALYVRLTEKRRVHEREVALQLSLREAELRALQRQVNPHFLFNCLNSIRGLVVENPPRAQEMVTHLANMLRYNLQRDVRETVPFASEMRVVNDYLALEGVRFDERLRVRLDVDPSVNDVEIPTMLLPTLVENAVTHGVAASPSGGEITIRAVRDEAVVRIDVVNPGHLPEPRAESVGLANIRERLSLLYGDRASLTVSNGEPGRILATVTIPLRP